MIDILKEHIKENLSINRYNHTISVYKTAIKLAKIYNEDVYKVSIAALCHDITKEMSFKEHEIIIDTYFSKHIDLKKVPLAWHGYTAVVYIKEKFGLDDEIITNAIKYHTLAHPEMDNIAKIIYIADFIEPTRKLLQLKDYYDLLDNNIELDNLFKIILKDNIDYLKSKGKFIPNQTLEIYDMISK